MSVGETARLHVVVPVDRNGHMLDAKVGFQFLFRQMRNLSGAGILSWTDVQGRQGAPGSDQPDVNMADGNDSGNRGNEVGFDFFGSCVIRSTLEEDVQGFGEKLPGAPQNQQRDEDRQNRVDRDPSGIMNDDRGG